MLFSVEHDPKDIESISKTCFYSGEPLPDFIRDEPELLPGLQVFLQAFWDLSTCRQMGMGLGPIPWTSIEKYANLIGGDDNFKEDFHHYIRRMDGEYLAWCSDKNKATTK